MVDKEKALVRRGDYTPALVEPISTIKKAEYFAVAAILTGAPLEIAGGGLPGLLLAAGIGSAAFYFGDEIRAVMQRVPMPKLAQPDRLGQLIDRTWWLTGKRSARPEEADVPPDHEQGFGDGLSTIDDYSATTEKLPAEDDALFPVWNPDDTGGIARLTIEQIVKHIQPNSYNIYIGRSLTKEGNPAVPINIRGNHFRFIGASQRGKSSMVGAFMDIVTRTHDPAHIRLILLDKEDQTSNLFAHLPHVQKMQLSDGSVIPMHARNVDQVVRFLIHTVAIFDRRYQMPRTKVNELPIILIYIEEFLRLKDELRIRVSQAKGKDDPNAVQKAQSDLDTFIYCIKALAQQGLKVRMQMLLCAQVEYADDDFKEAMPSILCGFSFCVEPKAAEAAGFLNHKLLKKNAESKKVGQAVVETPDCQDLVLAPEFNLDAKIRTWELSHDTRDFADNEDDDPTATMLPERRAHLQTMRRDITTEDVELIPPLSVVPAPTPKKKSKFTDEQIRRGVEMYIQSDGQLKQPALAAELNLSEWDGRLLMAIIKKQVEQAEANG